MTKLFFVFLLCGMLLLGQEADPCQEKAEAEANEGVVEMTAGRIPPPPDWRVRQRVLVKKLTGPGATLESMPGFLFDMARGFPEAWGRGLAGTGKRFASHYGKFALSEVIELTVESVRKEDPRYYRMGEGTIKRRAANVIKNTFVSYKSDGSGARTPAVSLFVGTFGAWAIAQRWHPAEHQTAGQFVLYGSVGLLSKMGSNALREFLPDVKRLMRKGRK